MRNLLLILIALPLVVFGGAKGYLWYQVKSGMDDFVKSVAPFADVRYSSIGSSFDGEAGVEGLEITPTGVPDTIRVGAVKLKMGDIFEMIKLKESLNKGKFPEKLRITIQNLEIDLNASYVYAMDQSSKGQNNPFAVDSLGCADIKQFGADDLRAMGFSTILLDFDMGYSFNSNSQMLAITANSSSENLFEGAMETRVDMGVSNLSPSSMMMGVMPQLIKFEVNYEDKAYNTARNKYCAGLNKEAVKGFIDRHVKLVSAHYRRMGISFSDELLQAYKTFASGSGSIKFKVIPSEAVDMATLPMYTPKDIIDLLNLQIEVNGSPVMDLGLKIDTKKFSRMNPFMQGGQRMGAGSTGSRSTLSQGGSRPGARIAKKTRVSPKQIGRYRGYYVSIVTRNGRELDGMVWKVSDGVLTLNRRISGGNVSYPIRVADIKDVFIRK